MAENESRRSRKAKSRSKTIPAGFATRAISLNTGMGSATWCSNELEITRSKVAFRNESLLASPTRKRARSARPSSKADRRAATIMFIDRSTPTTISSGQHLAILRGMPPGPLPTSSRVDRAAVLSIGSSSTRPSPLLPLLARRTPLCLPISSTFSLCRLIRAIYSWSGAALPQLSARYSSYRKLRALDSLSRSSLLDPATFTSPTSST